MELASFGKRALRLLRSDCHLQHTYTNVYIQICLWASFTFRGPENVALSSLFNARPQPSFCVLYISVFVALRQRMHTSSIWQRYTILYWSMNDMFEYPHLHSAELRLRSADEPLKLVLRTLATAGLFTDQRVFYKRPCFIHVNGEYMRMEFHRGNT